jgi:hypothetical protein
MSVAEIKGNGNQKGVNEVRKEKRINIINYSGIYGR